jgi:hypothetical protein
MKLEAARQIFEKYSNIIFRENPYGGSPVFPFGRTDKAKLTAAFRDVANVPKKIKVGDGETRLNCTMENF